VEQLTKVENVMRKIAGILFGILLMVTLVSVALGQSRQRQKLYQAKIMAVTNFKNSKNQGQQRIVARFQNGPYIGRTVRVINESNGYPTDLKYTVGNLIFIQEVLDTAQRKFVIFGPVRAVGLYRLVLLFVAGVVIIAGGQGIRSMVSLSLILMVIFYLLVPAVLRGVNPIKVTLILAALSTVLTIFLVGGITRKTIAAVIGTGSGILTAGFLAWYFEKATLLTGYSDEAVQMLGYTANSVNFKGLLFSGIIMGALGAIMDIAVSIASSINEIKQSNPQINLNALIASGFRVGKDAISTMVNTLVLAYVGSSFPLLMLYQIYQTPYGQIINDEAMAAEIVRMLAGSTGLLAAVPVTVFAAALLSENIAVN
jgi:uncharacterized membrane protein